MKRRGERWYVVIDGAGYTTAFRADGWHSRDMARYRGFVRFCQVRGKTPGEVSRRIRYAQVWAVHNLRG